MSSALRVGEALALDDIDVGTDEAALRVRHAKNNRRSDFDSRRTPDDVSFCRIQP